MAYEQPTELLPGSREHFGYADGFAQPALAGVDDATDRRIGGGVPEAKGAWRALAPGEFVLGYEDEDTRVDPERGLPTRAGRPVRALGHLHGCGASSTRTSRWSADVLREAAELYGGGDREKLAAKVVGRWPNGTPLVVSPDAPIADFEPKTDPRGPTAFATRPRIRMACAVRSGAHIRRTNPRDALGFGTASCSASAIASSGAGWPYGRAARRRRRRGRPRRPRPDLRLLATRASRASSRASRRNGSTTATSSTSATTATSPHGRTPHGTGKMTVEGDPPFFLGPQGPFVTTRGGAYLFVPGMGALRALAG